MQRVSLISKHSHAIKQDPLVHMVMECSSRRPTPTNREVGRNSTSEVVLLPIEIKEGLKLHFLHTWLHIAHHVAVRLSSDLGRPSHSHDFLIVFLHARLSQNVVQSSRVNSVMLLVLCIRHISLQVRVSVDARINVHLASVGFECCLELSHVANLNFVFGCELLLLHDVHPDLVQIVELRHEERHFLFVQVDD